MSSRTDATERSGGPTTATTLKTQSKSESERGRTKIEGGHNNGTRANFGTEVATRRPSAAEVALNQVTYALGEWVLCCLLHNICGKLDLTYMYHQ